MSRDAVSPYQRRRDESFRDREGEEVDCATGIPPTSPRSPFREGSAVLDRDEGIYYRCVGYLDPFLGWATTSFWQDRWYVDHRSILRYVEAGFLDAAIEKGSMVKRYRCRDEWGLLESETHKKEKARMRKSDRNDRPRRRWVP
jgi:hypothetical protein